MIYLALIYRSLLNRKFTSLLTIISICLSIVLLLGIERLRDGARESFANTISQTDLIVGAKGGTIQLLLYTVFRIGTATDNIDYSSYEKIRNDSAVEWTIPISLGDSHRGFRVVGTDENFYKHFRFQQNRQIEFQEGNTPVDLFDVVLGEEVAAKLGYKVGDKVVITHGISDVQGILDHNDKPFHVVGVLKRTSTPVDRSLYVSLEGIEAMHIDWQSGAPPMKGAETPQASIKKEDIKVEQITSFLVRAKNRIDTLRLQRQVNDFKDEALMAIIPAVSLAELWNTVGYAEQALRLVSLFVLAVCLMGMLVSLYTALDARRREMSILRALGAGPKQIVFLLAGESLGLTLMGIVTGVALVFLVLYVAQPWIESRFGLFVPVRFLTGLEWGYLLGASVLGLLLGLIPAIKAYRNTLSDGLSVKL